MKKLRRDLKSKEVFFFFFLTSLPFKIIFLLEYSVNYGRYVCRCKKRIYWLCARLQEESKVAELEGGGKGRERERESMRWIKSLTQTGNNRNKTIVKLANRRALQRSDGSRRSKETSQLGQNQANATCGLENSQATGREKNGFGEGRQKVAFLPRKF